ncbi:hypothetical protein GF340_04055 [Candidatus Peregrinibacteria bacterium]|nr:hypothetical protein [Candidatus Peregrinibacteria bacterium]
MNKYFVLLSVLFVFIATGCQESVKTYPNQVDELMDEVASTEEVENNEPLSDEEMRADALARGSRLYTSAFLEYILLTPAEWNKYNFKTDYKYVPANENPKNYELWEEAFTGYYNGGQSFDLLIVGRMPILTYDGQKEKQLNEIEEGTRESLDEVFEEENMIAENSQYYYYVLMPKVDLPEELNEGEVKMPDFETDFELMYE